MCVHSFQLECNFTTCLKSLGTGLRFPVAEGKSTVLKLHFLCGGLKRSLYYPCKYQRDKNIAEPLKTKNEKLILGVSVMAKNKTKKNNHDVFQRQIQPFPVASPAAVSTAANEGDPRRGKGWGGGRRRFLASALPPSASTAELRNRQSARTL